MLIDLRKDLPTRIRGALTAARIEAAARQCARDHREALGVPGGAPGDPWALLTYYRETVTLQYSPYVWRGRCIRIGREWIVLLQCNLPEALAGRVLAHELGHVTQPDRIDRESAEVWAEAFALAFLALDPAADPARGLLPPTVTA